MNKLSINLISLAFGLFCLVAGEAFSASRGPEDCKIVLHARAFKPSDLKPDGSFSFFPKKTVDTGAVYAAVGGGHSVLVTRIGKTWNSSYNEGLVIQGDPRSLALILGGDLAEFFGLMYIDKHNMLAPDATQLNAKIRKLNKALVAMGHEPVVVHYENVNGEISDYKLLKLFTTKTAIPMATNGLVYIHDLVFHGGTFILPNYLIEAVKSVIGIQLKFVSHLTTQLNLETNLKKKKLYQWLIEHYYDSEARQEDVILGNIVNQYSEVTGVKLTESFTENEEKLEVLGSKHYEGIVDLIQVDVERFFGQSNDPTLKTAFNSRLNHFHVKDMDNEEREWLLQEMSDFIAQNPEFKWDDSLGNFDPKHILYLIGQRIEEFKKALAAQ